LAELLLGSAIVLAGAVFLFPTISQDAEVRTGVHVEEKKKQSRYRRFEPKVYHSKSPGKSAYHWKADVFLENLGRRRQSHNCQLTASLFGSRARRLAGVFNATTGFALQAVATSFCQWLSRGYQKESKLLAINGPRL
jgi:hypothetical protein